MFREKERNIGFLLLETYTYPESFVVTELIRIYICCQKHNILSIHDRSIVHNSYRMLQLYDNISFKHERDNSRQRNIRCMYVCVCV